MKKKKIVALLAVLAMTAGMTAISACHTDNDDDKNHGNVGDDTEQGGNQGGTTGEDNYTVKINTTSTTINLDIEAEDTLSWTVTKNGATVTDEDVDVFLSGDSVTFDATTKKIKPVKVGKTEVTVSLKNHPEASAKVTYNINNYFFSREMYRGNINFNSESAGRVTMAGGQSSLLVKKASTKYVFKATVTLLANTVPANTGESFGIASFADEGDHALWFGAKSTANVGVYSAFRFNFYTGWGADGNSQELVTGYENHDFDNVNKNTDIEFEIIRDGGKYYYSIGGMYGEYTDETNYAEPTYPGIYSQNFNLIVKDFSVKYEADDVASAVSSYADKGIATVSIKEKNLFYIVNGTKTPFTAKAYPEEKADGVQLVWDLDKSELTAGADGTSISANGELTLADDADGFITVICKVKDNEGISDRFRIKIYDEIPTYSDGLMNYTGGVILNEDGSFTFPEEFAQINGVGAEYDYNPNENDYHALSKIKYNGAYSVEFAVANYKSVVNAKKLEVTLGDGASRFYIVYEGKKVEFFGYGSVGTTIKYGWYSAPLPGGFDVNARNEFKVEVAPNGYVNAYANGTKLAFRFDQTGADAVLKKPYNLLADEGFVKIATNGVTATVSDLDIKQGELALGDYYIMNGSAVQANGTTVNLDMTHLGDTDPWQGRDGYLTRVAMVGSKWAKLNGAYVLEYDVDFGEAMTDGKLALKMGVFEIHLNNTISKDGNIYGYIYTKVDDWDNGTLTKVTNPDDPFKAHVRIEVDANNKLRLIINGVVVGEGKDVTAPKMNYFEFFTLNGSKNDNDGDYKATVTNLGIKDYEKMTGIYKLSAGDTVRGLGEGETDVINLNITKDGANVTVAELGEKITLVADGAITFDKATMTVTALQKGEGTLTITVTDNGNVYKTKITYTVEPFEFHKTIRRGQPEIIKDADGNETGAILHNNPSAFGESVALKKAGTQWVFSGTLNFENYTGGEAIAISSGLNAGDNGLWFGLNNGNGNTYNVIIMPFYEGWNGKQTTVGKVTLNSTAGVNFTLIRNGNDYYYQIGGFAGHFNVDFAGATYPGLFTQSQPVTLTSFTSAYGADEVTQAIQKFKDDAKITDFTINADKLNYTSGETITLTATKNPDFVTEGYTWELDKSGLEGADGVSYTVDDNGAITITTGANSVGSLTVTVVSASGGARKSITLNLTAEVIPTENDVVSVYGAVSLEKDSQGNYSTIAFAQNDSGIGFNTTSDDAYKNYTQGLHGAILKEKVKGDFKISMTFSDFDTVAGKDAYLMLSLGGEHNQFYIVKTADGVYQLRTFTNTMTDDFNKVWIGGDYSREDLTVYNKGEGEANTLTVECVRGRYKVTINGAEYQKVWTYGINPEGKRYVGARRWADYSAECPVRIATQNASVKITDIELVKGAVETWYYNEATGNVTVNSENSLTIKADHHGWDNSNCYVNKVNYTAGVSANCTVEFDVAFSGAMKDGKLWIQVGDLRVLINNTIAKEGGNISCTLNKGDEDWSSSAIGTDLTFKLKVTRVNGTVSVYVNGSATAVKSYANANSGSELGFTLFNPWGGDGDDWQNVTVTLSNITVTNN